MAEVETDDTSWIFELETALVEECDFGRLRNICKGRPVPDHLRAEVWQICLGVQGKDVLSSFDGLYDMEEQPQLREDCSSVVDKLGNEEEDKVSIVSDLESIVTFYCKSKGQKYSSDNGWLDILQPLLAVKMSRSELYNCFYTLINKYIPRELNKNGKAFHLFRLLLQYHDPELSSYLDTRRITPDTYLRPWFSSLFARTCDLRVCLTMWDVLLQHADTFLVFFLALVLLVNAKDTILEMKDQSKQAVIENIISFPQALNAEDIEDFCSLAEHFCAKTPQSFKKDYHTVLFGGNALGKAAEADTCGTELCLFVSVEELLQTNQHTLALTEDSVRFFVVDCRPAEQYNSGHLSTAFHLDANLMLQNPDEFNTAVQALLGTQRTAIATGSAAGGQHLCFMGSGREEEDQYVLMVVAHMLQRNHSFISLASDGFIALHRLLQDDLQGSLADHAAKSCIVCNPDSVNSTSDAENGEDFSPIKSLSTELFGKLSIAVKSKSAEVKEKLSSYIKNDQQGAESMYYYYVATGEDGSIDSSGDEHKEIVSLETWLKKPDVVYSCACKELKSNNYTYPSTLLLTTTHLYILRDIPQKKGMAFIQARRALGSIVKITSKKKRPELITFRYGTHEDDGFHITDIDMFIIPTASEATKRIKQQIIKVLDALQS
ncbi:hypothetical protein C0Q70_12099 [Pomacea canaliculata]|uniref:TBC1 domain family member 23 n=1 Tax=Pomacea canaliculata TaxID=400727 RepID=A0A2T7P0K5_POMCA|nr:hypothetical protein C0Q70_12099 [Pomacea canaliculata]